MRGKFITLEGIEGSGKSTNLVTIKSILDQYKIDYVLTREPGGGPLGPDLRKLQFKTGSLDAMPISPHIN